MTRYVQVTARWQGEGWSAQIPEFGPVTAGTVAALVDAVALRVREATGDSDLRVQVTTKLPLELAGAAADTRSVREEAASLAARAEQLTVVTSDRLRGAGLSEADVAVVLGLPVPAVVPVSEPSVVAAVAAPVRRPPGRPRKVQSA
jgi:hypothetical protein